MKQFNGYSLVRRHAWNVLLPILLIAPGAQAADVSIRASASPRDVAFARYIAFHPEHDPFAKPGPVAVLIEASLPELYKSATLLAIRRQGEDQRMELHVLQIAGDGTATEEVIGRFFELHQQIDLLPLSSVAITPANYKFHFAGEVKTGGAAAYIYDITPKKRRPGLVYGKLWMDSGTGHEVMLSGHLTKLLTKGGRVDVVRDTQLMNGFAFARVTHVAFAIPSLGRAEVAITEISLSPMLIPQTE